MAENCYRVTARTLKQLQHGDDPAWNAFFEAFDRLIRSIVGWPKWRFDPQSQSEITQAIKSDIVKAIAHLDDITHLPAFIKRIGIRRCIDEVRRQVRSRRLVPFAAQNASGEWQDLDLPASSEFDPLQAILRQERAAALLRSLQELEAPCREVIEDFYLNDLAYKEIAAKRKLSINTVGTRLARCLEKLRRRMESVEL